MVGWALLEQGFTSSVVYWRWSWRFPSSTAPKWNYLQPLNVRTTVKRLEVRSSEERDREGYARQPQALDESALWEAEAAWPVE
jgi:hypothetical protein